MTRRRPSLNAKQVIRALEHAGFHLLLIFIDQLLDKS
jgi:hypothetical protein